MAVTLIISCKQERNLGLETSKTYEDPEVNFEKYDFQGLEPLLNTESDTIYVVNFWATWCAPCVEELPHFETLNRQYDDRSIEVILVSLDFPNKYDSHL